ncbi:glycine transporter [Anaeramoeba flamelloides]|uniref:Glycine transporter n=1 Tax=Anaeramoeba flamelloides TaxID=1746091 RepID=A0ABQ8Y244_9EUKA|nr:glycine transporter [Anaeramoeba flamelloides]
MFTFRKKTEKPSTWLKNGYYHLVGGTVSSLASTIVLQCNGIQPSLLGASRTFARAGIETMVFENIGQATEKKMTESNNPTDYWKIGMASGVFIAAGNSLVSTVFSNVYNYQDTNPEEETKCPYKTAYHMIKKEGTKTLFRGYLSNTFSKMLFVPTLRGLLAVNGYWLNKMNANSNSLIRKRVVTPFIKGSLSGLETSLIVKPLDEVIRAVMNKKKIDKKKITQKTWDTIRFASPEIGLNVLLYSNMKHFFGPAKISSLVKKKIFHK